MPIPAINAMFNHVHEWGEPGRSPATRMLLTRVGSLAGAALEALAIALVTCDLGLKIGNTCSSLVIKTLSAFLPKSPFSAKITAFFSQLETLNSNFLLLCKLVTGLALTLLLGVFFTPELNFRCHLKLGLVLDNSSVRKQKALEGKLAAEAKAAQIRNERDHRYAQFQANLKAEKRRIAQENAVDSHLAALLSNR